MAENLEEYTPQEIITQTDTAKPPEASLEPPKKISETEPDKNTNIPEPRPIPQIENPNEKKPLIDPDELDKAKKHLEKLYNPNSGIDVGADTPEKFLNIETTEEKNIPEQVKSVDIEKSIPIEKIELQENGQQETPEQLEEKKRVAEELRQKQIEDAILELEAKLKIIDEAREKKDKTAEHTNLEEAKMPFEVAAGKGLLEKAIQRADVEIKQENLVRMSPEQYKQKYAKRAEGQAEQIKKTNILEKRFAALSEQEKSAYTGENGLERFSKDMDGKIEAKRAELEKKGIVIPKNSFYAMMEEGLNPEQVKIVGWFSKKIEITHKPLLAGRKGGAEKFSKEDFSKIAKESEKSFTSSIKTQAGAELQREIKRGQDLWKAKKNKCMRDVIKDIVDGHKKQKEEIMRQKEIEKQKEIEEEQKVGAGKKPKLEIIARIGRERTPEQIKEMERIRKEVAIGIEKQKEVQKRIKGLIVKQKKGELLTSKEVAYLRAVAVAREEAKRVA